ncbi:PRC-barrel domain-containing protein [Streptomyces sp. NPDC059753]|uniref:PRC-barrel domain-containing protein n=1 Tax=Streptomyces sp. NPDC059753 TaxID=3346933 RepID=UPI003655319A
MIQIADIREWRTHDVVDAGGHKIGVLEAIYVNTSTNEPAMATVQVGLLVPLVGALVGPGYVKVDYDKALVKKCPPIGTDDVLPAEDEAAVFAHYGRPYQSSANGERRLARR